MFLHALADKFHLRADDEVSAQLLPGKMELIAGGPHIAAAAGQLVGLFRRIVAGGTRDGWRPNVAVAVELTERMFLG